mgnify:CR=1 FL=1
MSWYMASRDWKNLGSLVPGKSWLTVTDWEMRIASTAPPGVSTPRNVPGV